MSKLTVDQKTIKTLFQDKKADFLIPDYQRPYAWGENECRTLWDDIFSFAIPDEGRTPFDSSSEYFLGPIVTFKNDDGRLEIIDGQQRLTTIMLLLRAFYAKFTYMQDRASVSTRENIAKCLWKTDEFEEPDMNQLKIDSEVASDNDKDEFLNILRTGIADKKAKSVYACNFRFFQACIDEFLSKYPSFIAHRAARIMNNCILLPIEAESQDTALRIFSTLNDRGKPLSDLDIFKAQFYKFFSALGQKDTFIKRWKKLEELCDRIFHPITGTPMDELFTRYMYFVRATQGITSSTTEALRKFYEKNGYSLLKNANTFDDLITLAEFWEDVSNQDTHRFSSDVLKRLFVLNYAPNGMWTYIVSVYFMQKKDASGMLDDVEFCSFLHKITGFIWAYAVSHPGVNALRTPVYTEMVNIVTNRPVEFAKYKFPAGTIRSMFDNFSFNNARPITKAMITWWAYQSNAQPLLSLETVFEIEHIYARNRFDKEHSLTDPHHVESLGNKALLEKRINIRAADYRFVDKKKYYLGFTNAKGQRKDGTGITELQNLTASSADFTEQDILSRYNDMMDGFMDYLKANDLLQ